MRFKDETKLDPDSSNKNNHQKMGEMRERVVAIDFMNNWNSKK